MKRARNNVPRHLAQAVLTIDLDAIAANWRYLRGRVAPSECAAVVKADAYGTGLDQVGPALATAGCQTFFVAHSSEAIRLRTLLPDTSIRIYTLNGFTGGEAEARALLEANVRPVIGCLEDLQLWRQPAGGKTISGFGLQLSTGMNRLGFRPEEAADIAATTNANRQAGIDFVMSHFVASEEPAAAINQQQIDAFAAVRECFPGIPASLANSSGIFLPQKPHFELVRPGYALYGGNPCPGQPNPMRPVVHLTAPVLQVHYAMPGETAGYNGVWRAERKTRLAVIGIGYGDGLLRAAGGPGDPANIQIGGHPCPVAGRVSMDLTILDTTDAPDDAVFPGAIAEILGPFAGVDELAGHAGTIGYEILTSLGSRYHREYLPLT